MVIPVVVGALGAIADRLPGWLAQVMVSERSEVELQKSALLGTAQVLRCVFILPGIWYSPESENNTTHGRVREKFFLLPLLHCCYYYCCYYYYHYYYYHYY